MTLAAVATASGAPPDTAARGSLAGTWTLSAADDIRPDGTRVQAYGANPQGLLILGADRRYSVQIFRAGRARYASGDKRRGTPEEYADSVLGMSSHYGRYVVDPANGTLTFHIELASFPNWEGTAQKRPFQLAGEELSYRVPATPEGTVPLSVWRRVRVP